jgi:hypothetical protein
MQELRKEKKGKSGMLSQQKDDKKKFETNSLRDISAHIMLSENLCVPTVR